MDADGYHYFSPPSRSVPANPYGDATAIGPA